jgi:hypothetical protein
LERAAERSSVFPIKATRSTAIVPAGLYQVSVESYGHNFFQFRVVALVPGQQAYAKILSLRSWVESGRNFRRDTFYVLIIPPTFAQAEISHYPFLATAEP